MKKTRNILCSRILAILLLQSCCSQETLLDISSQSFVFLDKQTNKNLFFDPIPIYNKDSFFISYNNGNTFEKIQSPNSLMDSFFRIDFKYKDTCLLKFSNEQIDTLKLTYKKVSAKTTTGQCNLASTVLKTIQYNNDLIREADYSSALIISK